MQVLKPGTLRIRNVVDDLYLLKHGSCVELLGSGHTRRLLDLMSKMMDLSHVDARRVRASARRGVACCCFARTEWTSASCVEGWIYVFALRPRERARTSFKLTRWSFILMEVAQRSRHSRAQVYEFPATNVLARLVLRTVQCDAATAAGPVCTRSRACLMKSSCLEEA